MFSYAVVDEACRATNVLLNAAVTRELVHTFLRKHNPVLEIGHLSLVHLGSVEVWDRACLSVWDLWAMRIRMFSFLKMLVIL